MITTVRLEGTGDTPDQVKKQFDDCLMRLGFGIAPKVLDEVYERESSGETWNIGLGYKGRIKVEYEVPMNAHEEGLYDLETSSVLEMVNHRLGLREPVVGYGHERASVAEDSHS